MFFVYILAIIMLVSMIWIYMLTFNFYTRFDDYYVRYFQSYFINEKNFSLTPYFYKIYNYNWKGYNDFTGDWIDDNLNEDNIYCMRNFFWSNVIDDDCFFRGEYGFLPPNTWINLGKFDGIYGSWLIFYFTWEDVSNIKILVKYQDLDWRYEKYFFITWNSIWKHSFNWQSFSLSLKNLDKVNWIFFNIFLSWWEGLKQIVYNGSWMWIVKKKFNIFPGSIPLFFYDVVMKNYIFETPTNPVNLEIYTWDFDQVDVGVDNCSAFWYNDVKLQWYRYPQFRYVNWIKYLNTDYVDQMYFDIIIVNEKWWWKQEIKNLKLLDYCLLDWSRYKCSIKNIKELNDFFTGDYLFKINVYRYLSWWIIFDQQGSYFKTWHINYCR